jgi:hypothetical protein
VKQFTAFSNVNWNKFPEMCLKKFRHVSQQRADILNIIYDGEYSIHSLTHRVKSSLKSCQLCSYSRNSQHFMEPEGSLLCSQEPSTGPYPEPDQSNPYHPILSKIHFYISQSPTSSLLVFPPISLMHSYSPPFVLHALQEELV